MFTELSTVSVGPRASNPGLWWACVTFKKVLNYWAAGCSEWWALCMRNAMKHNWHNSAVWKNSWYICFQEHFPWHHPYTPNRIFFNPFLITWRRDCYWPGDKRRMNPPISSIQLLLMLHPSREHTDMRRAFYTLCIHEFLTHLKLWLTVFKLLMDSILSGVMKRSTDTDSQHGPGSTVWRHVQHNTKWHWALM